MNKAGVLRKAIEMIQRLQNENGRLKQENVTLKMEQQKRGTTFTTLLFIAGDLSLRSLFHDFSWPSRVK